ncbi:DUF4386 domain-containing protein [Maribacter cobaltidurans]|uniref:DUF4386 domain-containing protein n=1 Tax=Maribacter cobaltidurans TaxID=1178778 RepID=A0A223V2B3_9FLAO|nr:DUF4386 domain-containing protein [Maribacter cobaltidurans]ASV28989.1 hypothetical protein CJ263_01395 [Maribacter cobaltidurans]
MNITNQKLARLAGVIYLITVITGVFSLMYVPNKTFIWEDPKKNIQLFQEFEFLFRLSIVSEVLCYSAFLLLPILLHYLFKKTNKYLSRLMILFVLVAVPLSLLAISHKLDMLDTLGNDSLSQIDAEQLQSQIGLYYNKIKIAQIFWGLWLLPFGYLIYVSGILPKLLGVFLMLGGIGYMVNFVGPILFPNFTQSIIPIVAKIPSSIGEIGTCLWLLLIGLKKEFRYED